jgi:large subunit ribosomal protein L21
MAQRCKEKVKIIIPVCVKTLCRGCSVYQVLRKKKLLPFVRILKITTFAVLNFEPFRPDKRNPKGIPPGGVTFKVDIMYAIVEIAGQQFKVEKENKLFVHQLEAAEGDSVDFEKVLLVDNDGMVTVGTPVVEGAKVTAKVLGHVKGEKVLVFKKKRRKSYRKLNGHRQQFTQIQIESIVG